jgi:FkbM family methyltransferase
MFTPKPIAFVLASTHHGSMIVNRNDYRMVNQDQGYGVGYQLLTTSAFDAHEIGFASSILNLCRRYAGDGVVVVDAGANIGAHTLAWARFMQGWGSVTSFEAQERVYYALAGNIALNNCMNARVHLAALGSQVGQLKIPQPDHHRSSSFGSLELRESPNNEFVGQEISYKKENLVEVPMTTIDALSLPRLDFFKLDIEGMEIEALEGARDTIARCRPVLHIEQIKCDQVALSTLMEQWGYQSFNIGMNLLAIHKTSPLLKHFTEANGSLSLSM